MSDTQFMHFDLGTGRVTTAIKVEEHGSYTVAFIAAAFCSPKDQFNRKKGRLISEGRLNARKHVFELTLPSEDRVHAHVVEAFVRASLYGSPDLPHWASAN